MSNKKFKIKKGDEVIVIAGKAKGKSGKVKQIITDADKVLVEGVNVVRRHMKPNALAPNGILEKEAPLHISNVALLDPKKNKPTRVGYTFDKDGNKQRVAKLSKTVLS